MHALLAGHVAPEIIEEHEPEPVPAREGLKARPDGKGRRVSKFAPA